MARAFEYGVAAQIGIGVFIKFPEIAVGGFVVAERGCGVGGGIMYFARQFGIRIFFKETFVFISGALEIFRLVKGFAKQIERVLAIAAFFVKGNKFLQFGGGLAVFVHVEKAFGELERTRGFFVIGQRVCVPGGPGS
ncbi:MAG: hypothetical protein ACD_47C00633G0001 [uncultured bacterium]|nr:MAG: hypothetical protein ACD_47C00633G0001 [uncultured bacterium]